MDYLILLLTMYSASMSPWYVTVFLSYYGAVSGRMFASALDDGGNIPVPIVTNIEWGTYSTLLHPPYP